MKDILLDIHGWGCGSHAVGEGITRWHNHDENSW